MKKFGFLFVLFISTQFGYTQTLPEKSEIIQQMKKVNDYWMATNPNPGNNQWARSAYFTGCMDFYKVYPSEKYLNYMLKWALNNNWSLNGGSTTRNADNQTCGQVYFDLFQIDGQTDTSRISAISTSMRDMVNSSKKDDWWWIDALYMGMPVFSRLGVYYNDTLFFNKMHALYTNTKLERGLFNTTENLWYRDESFDPPYYTPNGDDSYWSRGNGWVIAAHVRSLQLLPTSEIHRQEYIDTYLEMAEALRKRQREDGFWNCSLDDPNDFGGPETSGTAFFTYSLAWGINYGLLDSAIYYPIVEKSWKGLNETAVKENGFIGYIQGVGSNPASSQPVTENSISDFGVGAYLLAGSEIVKLAPGKMPVPVNFNLKTVSVRDKNTIVLSFTDILDSNSARSLENYSINKDIVVENIAMGENDSTVILSVSDLNFDNYTLSVINIKNSKKETIEPGEQIMFVHTGIKQVTASGFESNTSNTPDKTIDFDLQTRWSCEGEGQWILYDLGETKRIHSIDLAFYNGASRLAYFKITLINENDSIEVFNGSNTGTTTQLENYETGGIEARSIRITGYGNSQSKWNSITETRINYTDINTSLINPVYLLNKESWMQNDRVQLIDLTGKTLITLKSYRDSNLFQQLSREYKPGIYILRLNNQNFKFKI